MALIVAPPGTGKSRFLNQNPNAGWVEGDDLYTGLDTSNFELIDKFNKSKKKEGLKILTSTWNTLDDTDAIVVPPIETLRKNLEGEEREGNDPQRSIDLLIEHNQGVPVFTTIEDAVAYVDGGYTELLALRLWT